MQLLLALCLLGAAAATDVLQCPGKSFEDLKQNVALAPCKRPPCKLKKGTNQHITISFTPATDLEQVTNSVTADVFGVHLPFIGVDGNNICDKIYNEQGDKAPCPLTAGTKYMYKDSFRVLAVYPSISVKVHWALRSQNKDIICFEVPAAIA